VTSKNTSYNNLIAVIAVASVTSIAAMVTSLSARVPELNMIARGKAEPIKGYERPDKNPFRDESKEGIPEGVSLPKDPSGKKVELGAKELAEVRRRFEQAVVLIHGKQYEYAIKALLHILTITTELPQVYVNLGFSYIGLYDYDSAKSAFERALELRADQANAYYGMAIVLEEKKQLEPALGAMRTFIHLANPEDKYVVKARSAIWEWEALLGRIPGAVEAPSNVEPQIKQKMSPHKRADSASKQK